MKRWIVKTHDGLTLKLFYRTYDDCLKGNPNSTIEECFDFEYLKLIDKIRQVSEEYKTDYRGRKIYKYNMDRGQLFFRLLENDEITLDGVQYQLWNNQRFSNPITWTMSDIEEFYNKFFNIEKMIYRVHAFRKYGEPKLSKPKELNKVTVAFSTEFIHKKCKCQCYIVGNDLWIKHKDYFSEDLKVAPEDFGTPLEYRCKKYLGKDKANKFIYPDTWGSIVCRNEAWIVFENVMQRLNICENELTLAREMLDEFSRVNKVSNTYFVGGDWEFFLERLAKDLFEYKTLN